MKSSLKILAIPLVAILLASCSYQNNAKIRLIDARTSSGVDGNYSPIDVKSVFPEETQKVCLWFSWKDAAKDVKLTAHWKYVRDNIAVLDYSFIVPCEEGQGSVALTMPEGKSLPPGEYSVTLALDKRELTKLTFTVLGKQ